MMEELINKRVKIIKGRDKEEFGTILEIEKADDNGNPIEFLIELNEGKILKFLKEDIEILLPSKLNKRGKYDIMNEGKDTQESINVALKLLKEKGD